MFKAEVMDTSGITHDPGRRFSRITSPDGYAGLSFLTDEQKQIGIEILKARAADAEQVDQSSDHADIQRCDPGLMLQFDPELFAQARAAYEDMVKLVVGMTGDELLHATRVDGGRPQDPETCRRYRTVMLMVAKVAREHRNAWMRLLAAGAGTLTREQLCLLDQPQSGVWSDEESLAIAFTAAFMNFAVTDELFDRAEALWGRKQLLRYSEWLSVCVRYSLLTYLNYPDAERPGPVGVAAATAVRHVIRSGASASAEQRTVDGLLYDPGRRFPFVVSPEGYAALSHLSAEERAFGGQLLAMVQTTNRPGVEQPREHAALQARNPSLIYLADPILFACVMPHFDRLGKLVIGLDNDEIMASTGANGLQTDDPDIRRRYNTAAMFMVAKIAEVHQVEWLQRILATMPSWSLSDQKMCQLGEPRSMVWNAEERLILEFAGGVINRTLTDEIFARAEAFWGRQQTLRYAMWIAYYVGVAMQAELNVSDTEKIRPHV